MYAYRSFDCPGVEFVSQISADEEKSLCDLLLDQERPIWERFRAFCDGMLDGPGYRNALTKAMWDCSSLLAYDAASELATMQDVDTIPALKAVLCDCSLHPIVRHKAAEALGAFGLESNAPALRSSLALDPAPEVRETCQVALRRIEELKNAPHLCTRSSWPVLTALCLSVPILREVLFGEVSTLYERVGAVFNLAKACRGQKKEEALSAIIEARGAKSALLRYWVVSMLSCVKKEKAVEALSESLRDPYEHPLVRQEAAKGLGRLAGCGFLADACVFLLEEFASDPEPIVAQRCQVALRRLQFEKSKECFEAWCNGKARGVTYGASGVRISAEAKSWCVLSPLRRSCSAHHLGVKQGPKGVGPHSESPAQVCIGCIRIRIYPGSKPGGNAALPRI